MTKRVISLVLVLIISISAVCFAVATAERDFELEYQWNLAVYNSKSTDEATYSVYKQPSPNIQSDDAAIVSLARSIAGDVSGDYEKARAIYTWVSGNVWYDWDSVEDKTKRGVNSALETYQSKRAICVGYSNLAVALLRATGIPALVAAGHAVGESRGMEDIFDLSESFRNGNHVWTEAYIGGRWVIMDVTWATNNKYRNGAFYRQRVPSQAYFDMPLSDLSKTHKYSLNYAPAPYPVIEFAVPFGVESITDYAFWRNASLKGITLSRSVTSIGYAAFGHCTSLKYAIIPDSVTEIGYYAFFRCTGLESMDIPGSVTKIGKHAFTGCTSLESIYIPDSVTSIERTAFMATPNVTITGSAGSYAQMYAKQNAIPFKIAD